MDEDRRVLNIGVTGSDGFIGLHLIAKLASCGEFTVREFPGDINDVACADGFVEGLDAIVHLAGQNRAADHEILAVNTMGTFNILRAMRSANPRARLVMISSFQVYTQWNNPGAIDESVAPDPVNIYGLSKKFAEDLCLRYSIDHGLEIVALRLSNVFGPGCLPDYNSVVATFVDRALRGGEIRINGDGASRRDYIYVSDVVDAIISATQIDTGTGFDIYNICSGAMHSLNDLVENINRCIDSPVEPIYERGSGDEIAFDPCSNAKAIGGGVLDAGLTGFARGIELTITEEKRRMAR